MLDPEAKRLSGGANFDRTLEILVEEPACFSIFLLVPVLAGPWLPRNKFTLVSFLACNYSSYSISLSAL